MTMEEWNELERLDREGKRDKRYDLLLWKTRKSSEHPEDYDGPCFCDECLRSD